MGTIIKGVCRWFKDTSQFNKNFKEHYNRDTDKEYFLEVDIQYPERMKTENIEKLVANLHNFKKIML